MSEIELRPYQGESVERLRVGIRNGLRRQILVAPTGSGKTEMAMDIISASQKKGATAWFIVDRITLIDQTSERFSRYGIDHGIIQADNPKTDLKNPVQIASAQTLARRNIDWLPDLIIWDEAHCRYQSVRDLIERASRAKVIGLTATPFTAGMADDWDGLVNSTTVNKLLDLEFLAPLKIKACVAPDMKGAKKSFTGEYDEDDAGERGIKIVGDVVKTWYEQTNKFFGRVVKTIVFSPSVKHGAELCEEFKAAGFNFQQISYLDKDEAERKAKIEEFRRPDSSIDGLVSCAVLTKGFDVPDVMCGISCRPYRKSFSSHIQEMGRVMRISPGKEFGLWLCHSHNVVTFAEETAWLFEHGVESMSDAAKGDSEAREPKESVKETMFCSQCGMQMATDVCPGCGWQRPTRSTIQMVQGELIDVSLRAAEAFAPRKGLRAECLSDPKAMWNAALSYCEASTRKGPDAARKWAAGVWHGIYPNANLPKGVYFAPSNSAVVNEQQWNLIEREVQRFRKGAKRKAA